MALQADSVDTSCADMHNNSQTELDRQSAFNTKSTDAWNRVLALNVTSRNMIENNLRQYDAQAKVVMGVKMYSRTSF